MQMDHYIPRMCGRVIQSGGPLRYANRDERWLAFGYRRASGRTGESRARFELLRSSPPTPTSWSPKSMIVCRSYWRRVITLADWARSPTRGALWIDDTKQATGLQQCFGSSERFITPALVLLTCRYQGVSHAEWPKGKHESAAKETSVC